MGDMKILVRANGVSIGDIHLEPKHALELLQKLYGNRDVLLKGLWGLSAFSPLRLACPACHSKQLIELESDPNGYYSACPNCGHDFYLDFQGHFIQKDDE